MPSDPPSSDLLLSAISTIAPFDARRAAYLSKLYLHVSALEDNLTEMERVIVDLSEDGKDATAIIGESLVTDLNADLRENIGDLIDYIGDALNIVGYWKLGSMAFAAARAGKGKLAMQFADKLLGTAIGDVIKDLVVEASGFWDNLLIQAIPPSELATQGSDIFFGNAAGGTVRLLGGRDLFVPVKDITDYVVFGGAGADFIIANRGGEDRLFGDAGNDTIVAQHGARLIAGGTDDDWLQADSAPPRGFQTISGGSGDDTIIGSASGQRLYASSAALDRSGSETDRDFVLGRGGRDTLSGSAGDDTLIGDNFDDSSDVPVSLFGPARATIEGRISASRQGAGNDLLVGFDGDDVIAGGGFGDTIYGDRQPGQSGGAPGADSIYGDAGNDRLFGGAGNDLLIGGRGADTLRGDRGADTLVGGREADVLIGSAGSDVFRFDNRFESTNRNPDRIVNFDGRVGMSSNGAIGDVLDISSIDSNPNREGHQEFILRLYDIVEYEPIQRLVKQVIDNDYSNFRIQFLSSLHGENLTGISPNGRVMDRGELIPFLNGDDLTLLIWQVGVSWRDTMTIILEDFQNFEIPDRGFGLNIDYLPGVLMPGWMPVL